MAISFNFFGKNKKPFNSSNEEANMYEQGWQQQPEINWSDYQKNSRSQSNSFLGFQPQPPVKDYQGYNPSLANFDNYQNLQNSNSGVNYNQNQSQFFEPKGVGMGNFNPSPNPIPQTSQPSPTNYSRAQQNSVVQNFPQANNSLKASPIPNNVPKTNGRTGFTDQFDFNAEFNSKNSHRGFEIKVPNPNANLNSAFKEKSAFGYGKAPHDLRKPPTDYPQNLAQNGQNQSFNLNSTFPQRAKAVSGPKPAFNEFNDFYEQKSAYQTPRNYNQGIPKTRQLAVYDQSNQGYAEDYSSENFTNPGKFEAYRPNPFQKKSNKKLYIAAFTMLFISATIFTFTFNSYQQKQNRSAVAGVNESSSSSSSSAASKGIKKGIPILDEEGYKNWIETKNKVFVDYGEDLDGDGLTNGEEFLLGTDPLKEKTCNDKTDVENLVNLVDPASCKSMDLDKEENVKKFSKFINIPKVKEEFLSDIQEKDATVEVDKKKSVLQVFEVASFTDLDRLNPENIKQSSKLTETKLTYLEMVAKIQKYIQLYRSQDAIDRNYAAPVHPAVYLDVALKYDVPLKYMLALARSESRFGTDRFNEDGSLTRPGQYKNIYSIGLDDSGGNSGFASWEAGVEGFGKWYQRFQKQGVSNCSKWRIYNPNGDYCAKVEALASEIQIFLDK